jgi:hypothetical protein
VESAFGRQAQQRARRSLVSILGVLRHQRVERALGRRDVEDLDGAEDLDPAQARPVVLVEVDGQRSGGRRDPVAPGRSERGG